MRWILLAIVRLDLFLHRLGERTHCKARLRLAWNAAQCHYSPTDLQCAFGARENQALALFAAVDEIDAQAQIESFGIVEQPQHHILCISPIIPEPNRSRSHAPRWSMRTGYEMRPAEQVHKQVAGHAAAIRLPLAPLEKLLRAERNLRRSAQKPRPVARLRRSIRRNGVVPCTHRRG